MKRHWSFILASIVSVPLLAGGANARVLGIATTPAGSFTNSSGAAIAKVIADHTDLRAVVQAQAAEAVSAVGDNTTDFGLSDSFDVTFYTDGTKYYRKQGPHKTLRYVASLIPFRVAMFVRANSDIHSIHDLKGKSVPGGFQTQRTIGTTLAALLANGGLTYKDVNMVPTTNVVRAAEDFDSGKTDVLFFALGSAAVKQAAATVGGIRALPLDTSPAAIKRVEAALPGAYVIHVKPAPNLDGITKPTAVIAFNMVLYASAKVPDDVVYQVTKAIYQNKKELMATFRPFAAFNPKRMAVPVKDVPYAPGAVKFYKEMGLLTHAPT